MFIKSEKIKIYDNNLARGNYEKCEKEIPNKKKYQKRIIKNLS